MEMMKKYIVCACAEQTDIEKSLKLFTLGGSLIPPSSPRGGGETPHPRGGGGRAAASRVYIRLSEG